LPKAQWSFFVFSALRHEMLREVRKTKRMIWREELMVVLLIISLRLQESRIMRKGKRKKADGQKLGMLQRGLPRIC
jgi:hypothetical protein